MYDHEKTINNYLGINNARPANVYLRYEYIKFNDVDTYNIIKYYVLYFNT